MARVSIEDLALAADWLDNYEAADADDPSPGRCQRVAAWIREEIERREFDAGVREVVKLTGGSAAQARRALRKATTA